MPESVPAPADALRQLPAGGQMAFGLLEEPLDEVLFALHSSRFTGTLRLGAGADVERVCFREGAVVGMAAAAEADVDGLRQVLLEKRFVTASDLSPAARAARDAFELGWSLIAEGMLAQDILRKAAEEHARRRLLALYDRPSVLARVQEGLKSLSRFLPIFVDIRPTIAFGTVIRAGAVRKAAMQRRAEGGHVRLIVPYDERRNSYGLPPPVLLALRDLADGVSFGTDVKLSGLSRSDSLGVLLLFDRMSLLTFAR